MNLQSNETHNLGTLKFSLENCEHFSHTISTVIKKKKKNIILTTILPTNTLLKPN